MSLDVEVSRLSKRFGGAAVVDDISFSIESGSFFSLLGPSGCGKTTTLRMLGGFEQPDSGTIRITGRDMAGVQPHRRPTNIVFQRLALFPHMTAAANIAFGLDAEGLPKPEIRSRVGDALDLVGLAAFSERKPGQLSGGQMQRVALARALAKRPKVLLLDEPLSALDLKLRSQMQVELKRIQREIGTTFVFVTHDQNEAFTMSDRVAVMNRGRIEQIAAPRQLYDHPATHFVAGFIGNANTIDVEILHLREDAAEVRLNGIGFQCGLIERPDGGRGRILVRWERVAVGPAAQGLAFSADGTVRDVIFSGSVLQYRLSLAGSASEIVAECPHTGTETIYPPGSSIRIGWDSNSARLIGT